MPVSNPGIYFADKKSAAIFAADGPKPQFFLDIPGFKVFVVGLEAGQKIPLHSGETAVYHFMEVSGVMTVGEETFAINPGVTVIAPSGTQRGMNAKIRVTFLGAKCG